MHCTKQTRGNSNHCLDAWHACCVQSCIIFICMQKLADTIPNPGLMICSRCAACRRAPDCILLWRSSAQNEQMLATAASDSECTNVALR